MPANLLPSPIDLDQQPGDCIAGFPHQPEHVGLSLTKELRGLAHQIDGVAVEICVCLWRRVPGDAREGDVELPVRQAGRAQDANMVDVIGGKRDGDLLRRRGGAPDLDLSGDVGSGDECSSSVVQLDALLLLPGLHPLLRLDLL